MEWTKAVSSVTQRGPSWFSSYHHPPASFKIAGVRGYIVYSGQPQYCRRCQEFGHLEYQCNIRCLNCKDPGHAASECPKPKVCKECGATDHLFKTCPKRKRTYASAARGEEGRDLRPIEVVIKKIQAYHRASTGQNEEVSHIGSTTDTEIMEGVREVSARSSVSGLVLAELTNPAIEELEKMGEEGGELKDTVIPDSFQHKTNASWGDRTEDEKEQGAEESWKFALRANKRKLGRKETRKKTR